MTAGPREVRAPRGTTLTAKSWQTEAPMRMLMNNLDPEVAERPNDLVVYGGTGKAARNWDAFDAIIAALKDLNTDETLLIQSGKPVAVWKTNPWAPRVLIANSNLVGDWATWPEFRKLEAEGLIMYGQMTAGSWIYIATQGILQGTFETFGAIARKRFGGTLAGTITLTGGCGGMGGAQPLAVTLNGGVCIIADVDKARLERRHAKRYLDTIATNLDDAITQANQAKADKRALSIGVVANAADVFPELLARQRAGDITIDIVTDQTPSATSPATFPSKPGTPKPPKTQQHSRKNPGNPWPHKSKQWWNSKTPAPKYSTTATPSVTKPATPDTHAHSNSPGLCPPTSDPSSAKASAPSAGPPSPATPKTSASPTKRSKNSSPTTSTFTGGSTRPKNT